MLLIVYGAFVFLVLLASILHILSKQANSDGVAINNPAFIAFQHKYFSIYILALLAEWLQAPYLYQLYNFYGFIDTQIAVIYISGFVSSVFFGTYAGFLADAWGRKRVCILFTILYSICCASKLSRNYSVLIAGRVLGGVSTSLLFSAFDSWYVHEHSQTHQFPTEWIQETFTKATILNSAIAIIAGIIANAMSEWLGLGPVSPFVLAIPFLIIAGLMIYHQWNDNYGKMGAVLKPCCESLRLIITNRKVFVTGAVQALFESVMYIFVFLWTPVLEPAKPPLGIVFSCFMTCILIGSKIFDLLTLRKIRVTIIIPIVIYGAVAANFAASYASADHPKITFLIFLVIEIICGIYFPAVGKLRYHTLPEAHHSGILNWFRVPLNAIAAVVLLALHDTHSSHGITALFALCAALLCLAGLASILLHKMVNETKQPEKENVFDEQPMPIA